MAKRKIIKINENKCDGCGLCIPNCAEGAIQIIDQKARLISDLFCDGLGACLGHCPRGAISIEEREAEEYNEKKVMENKAHTHRGCPGSKILDLRHQQVPAESEEAVRLKSRLANWPVQLMLVAPSAPYLKGADILIAADCVPFAYAYFHEDLLREKVLLVGCPKLDDLEAYREKITQILKTNNLKSITYAHMEVPCCFGLVGVIKEAIAKLGDKIDFNEVVIGIKGERIK